MNNIKETQMVLAKGSDPLEINEEFFFENDSIDIKFEPIDEYTLPVSSIPKNHPCYIDHTYFMKVEELYNGCENNFVPDHIENYPPGIERIVDVNDLLKRKETILNSSALSTIKTIPTTSTTPSENFENNYIKKEKPCGNCMKNIEHFCVACEKSWNYHKDIESCSNCQSTLKLQCKICHKRFKFLNKVQQYVLQASKQLNLLSRKKKQVTFTCERKQNFICSKCKYQTNQKTLLMKHMKEFHAVENPHKKCTTSTTPSESAVNTSNKLISANIISKSSETNLPDKLNIKSLLADSNSLSYLDNLLNSSKVQNLAEVAQLKNPVRETKEFENLFIELFCSKCHKTCKKSVYDEVIKPVCKECQILMLYRCTICANRYKLLKYVRLHVKRVCWPQMNQSKFNCTHCDYETNVKSELEFHIKFKHLPKSCPKCNIEVENAAAMELHSMQCTVLQKNSPICPPELSQNKVSEPDLDDVPLIIRQRELTLKNYLNEKLPIEEDDSYVVIENDPEKLINEIIKVPLKNGKDQGWRSLVDYYCLHCNGHAKKKFSRFRPRCPNCNIKYDYRCTGCEKLYGGYSSIYKHVQQDCPTRFEMGCSICDYTSTKKYLLLNHTKCKHAIYKCLRCNARCEGYLSLRKHQSNDCSIDNPHSTIHVKRLIALYCTFCHKRSMRYTEDNVLVPCEKCTIMMNYQCLKCNKLFNYRDVVYKHVKEECKPTFLCSKCNYKAYMQFDLDTHDKHVHADRKCQDCGVHFKNDQIFRMHRIEEVKKKKQLKKP